MIVDISYLDSTNPNTILYSSTLAYSCVSIIFEILSLCKNMIKQNFGVIPKMT